MMNIKDDSRKVVAGDTFIALRGVLSDGHDYIDVAIKNGATKIVAEEGSYSVETLIVPNTRDYLISYLRDNYFPIYI
jgi:UDP-N-acetylmuramoyl-L-alanyl-D-glutamate--2,6-diaminopimelate ligase